MSAIHVEVDCEQAEHADRSLARALAGFAPAMAKVEQIVADGIDANFADESAAGEPWAPLAASTVKERERLGYGGEHPILQRTGRLRQGATAHRSSDDEHAEVGPEGVDYAAYHCKVEGSDDDAGTPKRDFLILSDERIAEIDTAILAHLEAAGG